MVKKKKVIIRVSKWLVKCERVSSAGVVMRAFSDCYQPFEKRTDVIDNF